MKLTESEIREVELVWNGKTNEVTSIVLPFQVIEQVDEPRALPTEKAKVGKGKGTEAQTATDRHSFIFLIHADARNPAGRINSSGVTISSYFPA